MYKLGLDIGGTKTEAIILKQLNTAGGEIQRWDDPHTSYQIITRQRITTQRQLGYDTILTRISDFVSHILQQQDLPPQQLESIGIGMPGTVANDSQVMINGNSLVLKDRPFAHDLAIKLAIHQSKVRVANDANCFTLAESLCGAGRHYLQSNPSNHGPMLGIGIILGTGCGGGAFIGQTLLTGKNGGAVEIGHIPLNPNGPYCYCGLQGCSEQYLSGPALTASYHRRTSESKVDSKSVFLRAQEHDPLAIATIHEYKAHLLQFLTVLTQVFDPHFFVLGGGISNQPVIYEDLWVKLQQRVFLKQRAPTIVKNHLGDSAGVIGACLLGD